MSGMLLVLDSSLLLSRDDRCKMPVIPYAQALGSQPENVRMEKSYCPGHAYSPDHRLTQRHLNTEGQNTSCCTNKGLYTANKLSFTHVRSLYEVSGGSM